MDTDESPRWRQLNVGVIGGGLGGLATAISLRRAGHRVTIYERADYEGDSGSSISCGANGSRWLEEWDTDISRGKPVIIEQLIRHDLETDEVQDVVDLSDYVDKWGHAYYNLYRMDMHNMLMECAIGPGKGQPATLRLHHACVGAEYDTGRVTFANGVTAIHDLVVGADGIGSAVRRALGLFPERKRATSTSYHGIIQTSEMQRLGLPMPPRNALEYWGGQGLEKIIAAACRNGEVHSFYTFFPISQCCPSEEGWNLSGTHEQLLAPFPKLNPTMRALFSHAIDFKPWNLYVHSPYPYWTKGNICILGDAAHPMLPDQSQGACQAIEDAAALGIIFGPLYTYTNDVEAGLKLYEQVRKPRASKVQAASARARENLSERIGFSSQEKSKLYKVANESQKLTIEEVNEYVVVFCRYEIRKQADELYRYDMYDHVASLAATNNNCYGWQKKPNTFIRSRL